MACPNKNRQRSRTVAFRLTDDEFIRLEQRVKMTGEIKGDYLREMALNGEINISVGKFKSDKLALALKKLAECIQVSDKMKENEEFVRRIEESTIMIQELHGLIMNNDEEVFVY